MELVGNLEDVATREIETEIVELWSRLIEQLAGNVILFGMSKGISAQDTNPTRQPNFIFWCKVRMHKHKACHPKGTIQQKQSEDDSAAHIAGETAGDFSEWIVTLIETAEATVI